MSEVKTAAVALWVEMPAIDSRTASTRPKYPFAADALVVYRADSAFVALNDQQVRDELAGHSDVRVLSERERVEFEQSLPFQGPLIVGTPSQVGRSVGLGDIVSSLTRRLGIRECSGCGKRKSRLNSITVWRWRAKSES
jgi:hypothetical protein